MEVLISRATMKNQMKGNKMRKKNKVSSYKKGGGIGGLASMLSPAYSIMKGKGPASALASHLLHQPHAISSGTAKISAR